MAAGALAAFTGIASAQTNFVTVTNFVTLVVTNVVTITNVVPPAPATPAASAVATMPPPPAPVVAIKFPWQNAVSLGVTLTRGNSDNTTFTADYLGQKKTPFNEYKVGLSAAYGDTSGSETVNNYKAFTQWNHLFTDRFYGYLRVDGLRDVISDVDYRFTIGPGLGYYLLKTTKTTFAVEGGGAFEAQRLDNTGDNTFATLRLADRFEFKVNDRVRVWQDAEILPQVDRFSNYIVNFEIGVEAALTRSFALKSYFDDNFESRPAPGKLKNDAKLVTALSYKF